MAFAREMLFSLMVLACMSCVVSYKILVMVQMPSRSHHNLGKGIADILHKSGHEITFINCFPSEKPQYREIGVPVFEDDSKMNFELSKTSQLSMVINLNTWIPQMVEGALKSENVQKLLNDKSEKFDLVIVEYFMNEALIGFGVKYNCPVILISSTSLMHWVADMTGNPTSPATVPNVFTSFTGKMNLMERVANTAMGIAQELVGRFMYTPAQTAFYKTYFPEEAARVDYAEMKKKVALVFINSHPSIGVARPLLPNAIEIGGYHIGEIKPLPQDLQKILDNAKNGVVFFSMGSNLKSATLPDSIRNDIMKSLAKLKQTVLWKFEKDLPGKPANVIIKSWMPQTAILAHPNVKLFISHGGLLSCTEAAGAGVPILAIPIFGDQYLNAKTTQERGNGLLLAYNNLTETSFTWALGEMLNNPKYDQVAKRIHRTFHDRPMQPKDLVAFYAEHVIRTGGAPHLSPPDVGVVASLLVDVILVMLLPPLALLLAAVLLCKKCCCKSKKEQPKAGKQKRN